ncbi:MAG: efflux transporter outer membrane subunit [Verrucomicrobia bacterium]|nr:efflux transporter outer membrane subunit [Verrucomicrobiota bacterium]
MRIHHLLILIVLGSCISMSKEEQTENLIAPPPVTHSVEASLDTPYFSQGSWPEEKWWMVFASEELNQLILEALSQNPTIQAIKQRIAFAKQTAKVTRSELFPLVFFDANETWEYLSHNGLYRALNPDVPINANLVDLTLSFNYEFDFWGKNRSRFRAALGQVKAQEAEEAQVELLTTTALAQAYFALKTNLARKQLYEELLAVRSAYFSLQMKLQEKALLSRLPVLLSEESLQEAKKQVIAIDEEVITDYHLINILLGKGPDSPLEITPDLPTLPSTLSLPANLSIDLLARRPDLMAQIWRVEAYAQEVGAAKADFFPNINLKGLIGLESVLYRLLFRSDSQTAALEPAIHLPIFTAGAIRANVRAKKALFDEAVYAYNQLILTSVQEVADLLALATSVFEQKGRQDQIVGDAKERYELTLLRQMKGLDSAFETLTTQADLIERQLADLTLTYNQYLATVKLIKALGGGYQSAYTLPIQAAS